MTNATDSGYLLKRNASTVTLVATIVLLTCVCGVGTYPRPRIPATPAPSLPAISRILPEPLALSPAGLRLISWNRDLGALEVFQTASRNDMPVILRSSACVVRRPDSHFSWDEKLVAVRCEASAITIWNISNREPANHFDCSAPPHATMAWSHDGRYLAATCDLEDVRIWELPSGNEISRFQPHHGPVTRLAFTAKGQLVSSGTDGWIRFEDVAGRVQRSHKFGDPVLAFVLRSDGKQLVAQTGRSPRQHVEVYNWELETDTIRLRDLDTDFVELLALSPDGTLLILRTGYPTAVYSLKQSRYVETLDRGIRAAVFTGDDHIVAITLESVKTWE